MSRKSRFVQVFGVLAFLNFLLGSSYGFGGEVHAGTEFQFRTVSEPADVRFARRYLIRYFRDITAVEWDRALHAGEVEIARGDLNDDGVPEVFLLLGNAMWCGSVGCTGLILRKVNDDWKQVGSPYFSDAVIMTEKTYGYHRLFTGHAIYTFRNGKIYKIRELEPSQITR